MSAISGVFWVNGRLAQRGSLRRMVAAVAHRGPDGHGTYVEGSVGFAHQAFHVTDESTRERQPLEDEASNLALTADARIDNRAELLDLLSGQASRSGTDADMILAAFAKWGTGCTRYIRGDFVFAIWEGDKRELFLARDALGARSVCYTWDGTRFAFASQPSQLLALPGVERAINQAAVIGALTGCIASSERTPFKEISYLPPGHAMVVSQCGMRKWRYWDGHSARDVRYARDEEYAGRFVELLSRSTRARMRSTGRVGLSLSGGLDSTLLAAVAAPLVRGLELPQKRLETFSYTFDELPGCDEREYIVPVVETCDIESTLVGCDSEWTLRDLDTLPVEHDQIWVTPFVRLPRAVQRAARASGCRVFLDGQFGDGLFPRPPGRVANALQPREPSSPVASIARSAACSMLGGLRTLRRAVRRRVPVHPGLHPRLVEEERDIPALPPSLPAALAPAWSISRGEARNVANRRGLEVESPYFERDLVEFMLGLPPEQLHRPGRNRWIQRNSMLGRLPKKNSERQGKTGLVPLMKRGLLSRERDTFLRVLRRGRVADEEFVSGAWLRAATASDDALMENVEPLWRVCALELWLERVAIAAGRVAELPRVGQPHTHVAPT